MAATRRCARRPRRRRTTRCAKAWGPWTLELSTAATIFGDNEDFYGGQLREQDPVYSLQGHLVYGFRSGIWAALTGTYFTGGRTTVDGVTKDDRQKSSRVGATLSLPVNRRHSVKLYASTGLSIRTGTDFDAIGAGLAIPLGRGAVGELPRSFHILTLSASSEYSFLARG